MTGALARWATRTESRRQGRRLRERMTNEDSRSSIVIIEAGAGWPTWIAEYQRRAPNATVVAQTASETHEDFEGRVLHRLDEMGRGPNVLSVAVVLCSENNQASAL